jgi:tetratricopeptide (TPR) repeat protein
MRGLIWLALSLSTILTPFQARTPQSDRDRARPHVIGAWRLMGQEDWTGALKQFEAAVAIDPTFEDAYYGVGLAHVRLKEYGPAVAAYAKCRDLYEAQAGRQFTNQQEAQRYRRDRLMEIDEAMRQLQQGPQTQSVLDRQRQLQDRKRQLQDIVSRGNNMSISQGVPAFVYLALGSAFFRLEQWEDAEREYKSAIAADPKTGEAYNNLAVVYLTTGRYDEADRAVQSAEKAGYKVNSALKAEIKKKRG